MKITWPRVPAVSGPIGQVHRVIQQLEVRELADRVQVEQCERSPAMYGRQANG
jgi:hypothetical protein